VGEDFFGGKNSGNSSENLSSTHEVLFDKEVKINFLSAVRRINAACGPFFALLQPSRPLSNNSQAL
jgi:hypothetical protein